MEFKDRLMELRKQRGWSQEQLGEKIHVTRQTVSKWENGDTTPEMNKLIELGSLFDMSLDRLVGYAPNEKTGDSCLGLSYEYKSKLQLFGLPLIHVNIGWGLLGIRHRAKGVLAIGNIATGLVAVGEVALGGLSFGGVSAGAVSLGGFSLALLLSLGGLSIGTVALGGCAVGVLSFGGLAVGMYSMGGCAFATHIAAGGFAQGHIAIGDQVNGRVKLPISPSLTSEMIRGVIIQEFPRTWDFLVKLFGSFGR